MSAAPWRCSSRPRAVGSTASVSRFPAVRVSDGVWGRFRRRARTAKKRAAKEHATRVVRARVRVRQDVESVGVCVGDLFDRQNLHAIELAAWSEYGERSPVRRRVHGADFEHGSVREYDPEHVMSDDGVHVDALDRNRGDGTPVHAVNEIAGAKYGYRTLARGRGDRRVGRGAGTVRAAWRARIVHRVDAARRPRRAAGYDAAELSGGAALRGAAGAGSAGRGRARWRSARPVVAEGERPRALAAASPAVLDVVVRIRALRPAAR